MQYRLAIKSSYAETISEITVQLDGLFITKIKLISNIFLTHRATLRGKLRRKALSSPFTFR
jgi:hypothetical protein